MSIVNRNFFALILTLFAPETIRAPHRITVPTIATMLNAQPI